MASTALALLLALGCATYRPVNARLEEFDPDAGYRPETVAHLGGDIALVLAFSGGGTRAAALSYGVLEELRDTPIGAGEERRRLLDEVDVITSVSGGSFTSAYYGLFGDRIFEDFEERFLKRNVQRQLIVQMFRPKNWFRLAGTFFDRAELAIEFYDQQIFDGATFADLAASPGPMIQINAADLSAGNRFPFVQPQFDLLCSDLSKLKVARAVAASSAVPVLFNPITLRNFAGSCDYEPPPWLDEALASRRSSPRRFHNASVLSSYLDAKKRRYVHLVDGGIADNLGVRGPLDNVILMGGPWETLRNAGMERPKHIVFVVVNAEVAPDKGLDLLAAAPSLKAIVGSVSGVQINRYNFETLELLRESMKSWARQIPPDVDGEPVKVHMVELGFNLLEDAEERRFFNNVPTSFKLDDATVDRLREVGRRLLRQSEDFRGLLEDLQPSG